MRNYTFLNNIITSNTTCVIISVDKSKLQWHKAQPRASMKGIAIDQTMAFQPSHMLCSKR